MVITETEDAAGLRDDPSRSPGPVARPAQPGPAAAAELAAADLAADLRLAVGRLARSLRQADDGGLTPSQLSALSSIDALGSVRLGDLAAAERVTSPTLTKIVANLEAAGLVQRSADPDDRRAARVSLTPAGKSRLKRLRTERNAYLQQRLAALSADDRETLAAAIAVLARLAEAAGA
jgi:DNA-binding MarR family transcriptional regulator